MEDITKYLLDKVERVNINNPKANTGGKLLKTHSDWEANMSRYVQTAIHTMQMHFARDTSSSPIGSANLTNVSTKVGENISRMISNEEFYWNEYVRLGDLFVEAFYNTKYIDIYYVKARESRYILNVTERWTELRELPESLSRVRLAYTTTELPELIQGATQDIKGVEYPIVKGQSEKDELDTDTVFVRAINKAQRTGWRINRRVLEAITTQCVPSMEPEKEPQKEQRRRSKVVSWNFIMHKAHALKDEDVFYQYIDADYRGRLYYKEGFFNYQSADTAKGVMKFAKGKPMTATGKYWLAIHTASSFNMSYGINEIPEWCEADYKTYLKSEGLDNISVDKMTLNDRVEWTNQYMDDIIHAGKEAIVSDTAEKEVSFLACCVEWYDISICHGIHYSHLPIPIDGSNNGWQHLGAISKDPQTGSLVGLVPVDIQKDFYVQTAKEMINLTTDERLISILDKMPMKKIRKGISKRGSMTRAYSAGASKIAENMYGDCVAEGYHDEYGITQDDCTKLAKILIKAINNVCPGPLDTMEYLQKLAQYEIGEYVKVDVEGNQVGEDFHNAVKIQKELYINKERTSEEDIQLEALTNYIKSHTNVLKKGNGATQITWRTPSGFNVVYENFKTERKRCRGTISGYRSSASTKRNGLDINHVAQIPTTIPDMRGFMCGISPNFIHSLDASHMSLVIDSWNGSFGAVHDSFSTHACDVESLLEITKDKFIEIYDKDNFYDYIQNEILMNDEDKPFLGEIPEQPHRGSLKIQEVTESDYFFA